MKTAVTVLQEMMIKMGLTPEYEIIDQTGPQHQVLFEMQCQACGEVAIATARSKKEAKQEVARIMLLKLAYKGHFVPAPFGLACGAAPPSGLDDDSFTGSPADTRSYVALLKELCDEYRLETVDYELVGDTGPPHLRHFTIRARIGQHERFATSTTKKQARQLAAEKLYSYLRENLARVTKDFNEEEALARAHDKAMDRHQEPLEEQQPRMHLGQKIADYHLGLVSQLETERCETARSVLREERDSSPERVLTQLVEVMRLELSEMELAGTSILELVGCWPALAFAGSSRAEAADAALRHIRQALDNPAPETTITSSHGPELSIY